MLDGLVPADAYDEVWRWPGGTMPLRVSAYLGTDLVVPDELVTSVRCVVEVAGQIVVCRTPSDLHALPGGRREPGETYAETAAREVREETGWQLDERTLRPLGLIHLRHLAEPPPGYAYPYPDFVQLVFAGLASDRVSRAEWVDTEGWEQESFLVAKADVLENLTLTRSSVPFVRATLHL